MEKLIHFHQEMFDKTNNYNKFNNVGKLTIGLIVGGLIQLLSNSWN